MVSLLQYEDNNKDTGVPNFSLVYIKSKTLFYEPWKMRWHLHNARWIVVSGIILMPLGASQRL